MERIKETKIEPKQSMHEQSQIQQNKCVALDVHTQTNYA